MGNKLSAIDLRFFIGCPCYQPGPILATIDGINIAADTVISENCSYSPNLIKPILRRFENLSRQEVEQLNKLWPSENIKRTAFGSIQLDAQIINYLTLLHVDVFGWIDQGLAIDAAYNTLN